MDTNNKPIRIFQAPCGGLVQQPLIGMLRTPFKCLDVRRLRPRLAALIHRAGRENMKKSLLAVPLILVLAGCGSDIDLVKGGVMEFNQTTTLGKTLDNWKSCENREWGEFEADNGIKVVQFTCQHKVEQFMSKAKSLLSKEDQAKAGHLDITSSIQTFQFTINKGDTFQIDNVQIKTTWKDGTYFEDFQKPVEQLESAYANNLNFDPSDLNKMGAEQISYIFSIIKTLSN